MARSLVWIEGADGGWACSNCRWKFPVPTLLSEKEAKDAYDRLAAAKFGKHECEAKNPPTTIPNSGPSLADRARVLIMRGYKPKIAVELVLHDLEFENPNNPEVMKKARDDAEDFLLKIGKGLI
jgi:hypothetical protein